MAGKKDQPVSERTETAPVQYRNRDGNTLPMKDGNGQDCFHDPNHLRCHGTGFLLEHVLKVTADGERWSTWALDCSCRVDLPTRANFDRDRPIHAGMTQGQLDEARDLAMFTPSEREAHADLLRKLMALPPGKRFGAIMDLVKPKNIPDAKVIE